MENKLIERIRNNKICAEIMESVDDIEKASIEFTVHEIISLRTTCYAVYNSFCNNSDEDDGLSSEMNRYLDDLESAISKLEY